MNRYSFLKVAAATPIVKVADCHANCERIEALLREAAERKVDITVFPELSVCGYTCGDLVQQSKLLDSAEEALQELLENTTELQIVGIVGMPVAVENNLYNTAVVFARGNILGVVPKSYIPNYSEFYESRWFASGTDCRDMQIVLCGQNVPFGTDVLFAVHGVTFGTELCEDLWIPVPPSSKMAMSGAKLIFNLSATPEIVGKHAYVRSLVEQQSARDICGYVYCSAGIGESSTDSVFTGNGIIAENGTIIAAKERFVRTETLTVTDIDIEYLENERRRRNTFINADSGYSVVSVELDSAESELERDVNPLPFIPQGETAEYGFREILSIQQAGLAQRLSHTGGRNAVIGISGGLDSTLSLLVTVRTFDMLGLDRRGITAVTMPGFGTTDRTYHNAVQLIGELGVTLREIPIRDACLQHFKDIGITDGDRSIAYENSQARERTQILMDIANMVCGMVIGTGDLSEAALGWSTYNGDHMSMYNVNCAVPKTLVRKLVEWIATSETDSKVAATLRDVVATPVSPELLPAGSDGKIAQKTEDLVGPYELHDFFIYHFMRNGFAPAKIYYLACRAYGETYNAADIKAWLCTFLRRFFSQQYKRSAVPDGPKIGSVSLSPRGDWRMPSDACAAEWIREAEDL